ncbi:MAG: multiple sugar transport system substrate-binding protein [Phycisphaerales bacterium]|nr:multiple sugar transport system substrate-binding protein [Phycisphaerales bacterium]
MRDGAVTLDFYTYSTPEFRYLASRVIPAFEKTHPGIKVRINEGFGELYDGKLLTLIAGKVAPDVFHVVQSNFPSYAAKNICLPLDELAANDKSFDISTLYPLLGDAMRYDGKLLGLPSDFSPIVMAYNVELFDRMNVPYPKPDWTWADFLATCHALTKDTDGDGKIDTWGCTNQPQYNRWPAWVWMNGGDIFNADVTRCVMDSPQAIGGFEFYTGLSLTEKVAPRPNLLEPYLYQALFASGRVGMIAESRYIYKRFLRLRKLDFKWDLAPMPRGPAGQFTTYIWGGNCVFRGTKHPKEAWQFVKYLTGPQGAEVTLDAGNALPPLRSAAEAEIARPRDGNVPKHDRYFVDAIAYGRVAPFPRQYPELMSAMTGLHESFLGEKLGTPEEACVKFTKKVNAFLDAGVF